MKFLLKCHVKHVVSQVFLLSFILSNPLFSQVPNTFYQTKVNLVDQNNITSKLQHFESLGVKSVGTTAQENTYQWLLNQYLSFGYTQNDINTYNFTYSNRNNKNLEVTKRGTVYPNTYVIVCSHFDTKNGPGVNDNGSGVITILEIARILANIPTDYSIRFINFSGEEDGLIGSRDYVNNVVNSTNPKMDIKLVFNIDEVGGVAGLVNNKVYCERDLDSPLTNNALSNQYNQNLMQYVSAYSNLSPVLARAYASDYMPFQANNEVIVGLFEFNESTHPHSPTDLLINMDPVYNLQIAKAATGAVLHYAVARETLSVNDSFENGMRVHPNPAKESINIYLEDTSDKVDASLYDINGKLIINHIINLDANMGSINATNLSKGLYLLKIMSKTKVYQQKLFIK